MVIKLNKLVSLAFSCSVALACKAQERPNVLFIAVDDLRPELACYGNKIIQSPNLDKLAAEGCIFTNHYVQVATCGASRYSLLCGKRPISRKYLSNEIIKESFSGKRETRISETFIHQLKRNGYYTVGIGKISHYPDGLVYGYTDDISSRLELPHSWSENVFDHGKWGTGWNAFFGYAKGENRQSMNRLVKPYECADVSDEGYPDGLTANLAVSKLQELKQKDKPFFLGIGFFKPHLPFTAPKKYWDLYEPSEIPISEVPFIPENVNRKSLHSSGEFNGYHLTDEKAGLDGPVSDDYARKLNHAYYSCVSYIDAQIGKVLDELKRLGLDENTIVVIWGDHGWHLGDQLVWGKHTLFEKSLKSVLIVKSPHQLEKGIDISGIVETIDIYPTIMELCGIDTPDKLDGESFAPALEVPSFKGKEAAYSYFRNGISMRTERYRLTKYFREENPVIELYDHENDPNESKNIAGISPDIVKQLMPVWAKGNTGLYNK